MAWTTPRTWAAGETLTAALLNTHLRDNLIAVGTPRRCQITASSTTDVPDNAWTLISFDGEVYDSDAMHSTGTNPSRVTANATGDYAVHAAVGWAANNTGMRGLQVRKNAAGSPSGGTAVAQRNWPAGASTVQTVELYRELLLTAGDYIELFRYQSSGGNLSPTAVDTSPGILIVRQVSA